MSSGTFLQDALSGRAGVADIDAYVDGWGDSDSDLSLHEYLGFTWDEYRLWVEKPESLRYIIAAHRHGVPVSEELERSVNERFALAARAESSNEAEGVLSWLQQTGRL
ncbi:hypothetical protein ACFYY3_05245 [Streptomyces sp. NPDC001812]|uniref:hypothetical protein n=1 Tax=Streptomyces sp. NPDC001812 TaxID=3364611 RepID=UPI0036D0176C